VSPLNGSGLQLLTGTNSFAEHSYAIIEWRVPMRSAAFLCSALMALVSVPAEAGDLFGGVYVHDVKLPTDKSGIEGGADIQVGYRFGNIVGTPLRPYVFGALNTAGETNYAAVGLSAKFGRSIYIRPGLGLAIQTGSAAKFYNPNRIAFGSRVLFEPELNVGTQINDRLSVEASWVHMSHAQLFAHENPGIDNLGVRLNLAL
jgi:lipid A 3-O-deacylase